MMDTHYINYQFYFYLFIFSLYRYRKKREIFKMTSRFFMNSLTTTNLESENINTSHSSPALTINGNGATPGVTNLTLNRTLAADTSLVELSTGGVIDWTMGMDVTESKLKFEKAGTTDVMTLETDATYGNILSADVNFIARGAVQFSGVLAHVFVAVTPLVLLAASPYSIITVDSNAAIGTVTLPTIATSIGRILTFRKVGTGTNIVTLDAVAGLIDGIQTHTGLTTLNDSVTIMNNGFKWVVVNQTLAADGFFDVTGATYTSVAGDQLDTLYVSVAGVCAITLPVSADSLGRVLNIYRAASATAITITPASGTIDGNANDATCDAIGDSITIRCDGTNWVSVFRSVA